VSEPQFYHFVFAFYAKKISSIFSTISEINVSIKKMLLSGMKKEETKIKSKEIFFAHKSAVLKPFMK